MTAEQSIRNIERVMNAVNAATQAQPDPRADLVDLFEAHAETHYDKSWIEVEEAVDLVVDREAGGEWEYGHILWGEFFPADDERTARLAAALPPVGKVARRRKGGPVEEVQS